MPLKTRYTRRVFTRDIITDPPMSKEEVWRTLGGPAIGRAMDKYICFLEFLEDLYPTDEDENEYREFLLGCGDKELAALGFNERQANSVIKKFVEIRGLIITDKRHLPNQRPRAYVYDPRITDTLEEVYKDHRHRQASGEPYPADPRYIGPTGKVILEQMPTPSRDEVKAHFWRKKTQLSHLLELVAAVENTIGQERGDKHAEFWWQGVRAELRAVLRGKIWEKIVKAARQWGLIKRTTTRKKICAADSAFIYNGELGGLLLETWQEMEAEKAAKLEAAARAKAEKAAEKAAIKAAKKAAREARAARGEAQRKARERRQGGDILTGRLVAVEIPPVDKASMLSHKWTSPTWRNLAALVEFIEAHGAANMVDGMAPEFCAAWQDLRAVELSRPGIILLLRRARAAGIISMTRRGGYVTPRSWAYNPAAGAIVKEIWGAIVERAEAKAAKMVERGNARRRKDCGTL